MGPLLYNTNGFAHHRLEDVVAILADLGYDGIALTPDVHHLDPLRATPVEIDAFGQLCRQRELVIVVETGARFVLDARRKHRPSLLDAPTEASRRTDMLLRAIEMARRLEAPIVSLWSGSGPPGQTPEAVVALLGERLRPLCDHAAAAGVRLGFEPEPGMAVETAAGWRAVRDAVDHEALGLTLDVGHCLATGEGDPADVIRAHAGDLVLVQLDDHRAGVHDHLAFGEGEVDFRAVGRALAEVAFEGPLEVELSRHASTAPATAAASITYLRERLPGA